MQFVCPSSSISRRTVTTDHLETSDGDVHVCVGVFIGVTFILSRKVKDSTGHYLSLYVPGGRSHEGLTVVTL